MAPARLEPPKIRMLVLETDEPHPDTQSEQGSFGQVLHNLLEDAGKKHDPELGIETKMQYCVEPNGGKIPAPEDIEEGVHAVLITGSVYDAHSDEPWILKLLDLVKHLYTHRPDIRFTGICFGHQILCRALGARIEPNADNDWELSHTPIQLTPLGQSLFALPKSQNTIRLHQMHLDHVISAPSPSTTDLLASGTKVHVWGSSDHTGVQGIYIAKRVFTTQGHMEFSEAMVKRQLEMRVKNGALGEGEADEATVRAEWEHDGEIVAKAVLRFFHGDDDAVE